MHPCKKYSLGMAFLINAMLTFPHWVGFWAASKYPLLNCLCLIASSSYPVFPLQWSILWMFLHDGHMLPSMVFSFYFSEDQKHLSALITKSFPAGMSSLNGHRAAIWHWQKQHGMDPHSATTKNFSGVFSVMKGLSLSLPLFLSRGGYDSR